RWSLQHFLQFLQTFDRLADGLEVGQQPPGPAVVDVEHAAALGLFPHHFLRLLLGADKQQLPALGCQLAYELARLAQHPHGLLQIDDVDTVAGAEDIGFHLGAPPAGLVAEMDPRFKQLLDRNVDHESCLSLGDVALLKGLAKLVAKGGGLCNARPLLTDSSNREIPGWFSSRAPYP